MAMSSGTMMKPEVFFVHSQSSLKIWQQNISTEDLQPVTIDLPIFGLFHEKNKDLKYHLTEEVGSRGIQQ
jgi:hypothetical protein